MIRAFLTAAAILAAPMSLAQGKDPALPPEQSGWGMTPERLAGIITAIDANAQFSPAGIEFMIEDVPVLVVMDPGANRMRAMVPVASAEGLTEEDLLRMMQANFDTALDARYAIAQGRLWSVFIHPLSELQDEQLVSGLAQAVTLAQTYGQTYSSGGAMFGHGDSGDLLERLLEGEDI